MEQSAPLTIPGSSRLVLGSIDKARSYVIDPWKAMRGHWKLQKEQMISPLLFDLTLSTKSPQSPEIDRKASFRDS